MTCLVVPLLLIAAAYAAPCPQQISEPNCAPSSNCSLTVCGRSARCLAWENQTSVTPNCCSYLCGSTAGASGPTCFAKWFDNPGNALNCDPCAGANCQNRTAIEAACASQYGANGYNLVQPDPSVRRCCLTCTQKPFTCPQQIAERCSPSTTCASNVCSANARCPAWENEPSVTPNCCSYACGTNGTTGGNSTCFAKWFDKIGNALNCDICAGASCANRTTVEANCAAQYGANGYTIVEPDSSVRRCCLTCTQKPFSCPQQISEANCPPSSSCAASVCSPNARCPAWENQPSITPHCCSYACGGSPTSGGNSTCFAKWFDKVGNALNCDVCAGASCPNRTTVEANCAAQYGANGYNIVEPDSSVRRCCLTCTQKAFSCPTQISEGCPPSANCSSSVCANARCLAWENQTITPNCCSYQCSGAAGPKCFAKWFDKVGNALNCDPCAGATGTCTNRTAVEANCANDYGANGYDLVLPDPSVRRCCYTCTRKPVTSTCPQLISEPGCSPSATCAASVCSPNARCPAWENQPSTTPNCCSYTCGTATNSTCFAKWFDNVGNALNCDICAGALCDDRISVEKICSARYGANGYKLIDPDSSVRRCCITCEEVVSEATTTIGEDATTAANGDTTADTTGGDISTSVSQDESTTSNTDAEKSGIAQSVDNNTDATGANAIGVSAIAIVIVIASIMMN